jgi:hypothetical protein
MELWSDEVMRKIFFYSLISSNAEASYLISKSIERCPML